MTRRQDRKHTSTRAPGRGKPFRHIAQGAVIGLSLVAGGARADTDIAHLIVGLPGVPEAIANICNEVCLGNERKSWLDSAVLEPDATFRLNLRLRNRHVPFAGVVLYDDTAKVTAKAKINFFTCEVSDWSVSSNNDAYAVALILFQDRIAKEIADLGEDCRGRFFP